MIWANWNASSALRLPACCIPSWVTTAVESIKLFERRMVFPIADDSRGSVSIVRQRIGRATVMLL